MSLRAAILWLTLPGLTHAADWPHVRGPDYDAKSAETGLIEAWPESGPPQLWTRDLGPGYSGFVVAKGRAFTLYQNAGGMFLLCLDLDRGSEIWKRRVDWPWQPGGIYPGPYASPTWSDGRVYYATPTGLVGCVRAQAGESLWTVNVREKFRSRGTEFGFASTPLVEDGRVILPVGGPKAAMVALNAADGSTLWTSGDDPASYCPAYPITLDGRRLIVGFFQNSLNLYDPKSGELLWRETLSNNYDEHAAWPLFDGRHLLIASPFRIGAQLFSLRDSDKTVSAKSLWHSRKLSNDVCSSLLHKGTVYGFDLQQAQASVHRPSRGAFKCLDFVSGKVHWETKTVGQSSVVLADGKLIVWSETGDLVLARPNMQRYEEIGRVKVLGGGGMCWAAPALSGKRLLVRDHQRAVCLYLGPPSDISPEKAMQPLTHADTGFDWTRLVPREPDYANDAPSPHEAGRWFAWCAGIYVVAGLIAILWRVSVTRINAEVVFAIVAMSMGAGGTTLVGIWYDEFILTWPVSLYLVFRVVVGLGLDRAATGWRHQVVGRLGLLGFVGTCYGYYRLCMAVGYAMAWGFLCGFPLALPLVVLARKTRSLGLRYLLEVLGFVVYFWTSVLVPGLKSLGE